MVKDEGVALAGDVLITEPNLPKSLETMALGSDPPHSAVQETAGEAITDQDMPLGDVDGDGSDSDDDATDRYRLTTNPETVRNVSTLRRRGDAVSISGFKRASALEPSSSLTSGRMIWTARRLLE